MSEAVNTAVEALYRWLDAEIAAAVDPATDCSACGACCDFDVYDHRLYVTAPELLFFQTRLGAAPLRPMTEGICPYREGTRCTVHPHRFAGCRIFGCRRSEALHERLSTVALRRCKAICETHGLAYRYLDLATALNTMPLAAESHSAGADRSV